MHEVTELGIFSFRGKLTSRSVSEDLLCAFELLKPLDAPALRKEMSKVKRKRCVMC